MDLPKILYHYTSFETFLAILKSRTLRASDARYLNDKSEVDYGLRFVSEHIHRDSPGLLPEGPHRDFLCCFSSEGNLLSQWRAYCPMGGVSIGFSSDTLSAVAELNNFLLKPCAYSDDERRSVLAALDEKFQWLKAQPHPTGSSLSVYRTEVWHLALQIACQIKHRDFFAESEWRLIFVNLWHGLSDKIKVSSGGYWLRPFIELDLNIAAWRIPPSGRSLWDLGIREVIVGPHPADKEMRVAVGDALRANSIYNVEDKDNYMWGADDGNVMNGIAIRYCDIPFRLM